MDKLMLGFMGGMLVTAMIFFAIFFMYITPMYLDEKNWASNLCSDDAPEPCIGTLYYPKSDLFCFYSSEAYIKDGVIAGVNCITNYKRERHAWYDE